LTSQVMDVTLPLNFLVDDSGQLKVFSLLSAGFAFLCVKP